MMSLKDPKVGRVGWKCFVIHNFCIQRGAIRKVISGVAIMKGPSLQEDVVDH